MKTNEQMAKTLYELLREDCKGCFDTTVSKIEDQVKYADQGGWVSVDFKNKTITRGGNIYDTFGCQTKSEVAEYVDENTVSLIFYLSKSGITHAEIKSQYDTFKELRSSMEEHGAFIYLDLDKVFN